MVETRALSPHLGVEVTGVESLLESRALLEELTEWCTQPRFRYTHEWQQGDLVVWDNTGMLHRALPYDVSSQRTLHRTTVRGEEAFA
jgi:alpha-ketoglutarate-dependent taurine dioxygenase